MARLGNGWLGSSAITSSIANMELVPPSPSNWMNMKLGFYKFELRNLQACTVKINGGSPIYLDVEQGFISNSEDAMIYSFVIVEPNIQYQWLGAY
ncbi:hypothetical protein [Priestia aryabhattai]|uniref:hypothetical protein n=1 Tax=Priestia aryabhattai TaxID=412384 RepID=UPI0015F35A77|nr:hypothetical protein [Priestia aryabhattai]